MFSSHESLSSFGKLRLTGASGTETERYMSSDTRLNERRERGTHREGDGALRRRFCVGCLVPAFVGTGWCWLCKGDTELLPRGEEDEEDMEETEPLLCEMVGDRARKEFSGDCATGEVCPEVSSHDEGESEDDFGGEEIAMFTGLSAQRLT